MRRKERDTKKYFIMGTGYMSCTHPRRLKTTECAVYCQNGTSECFSNVINGTDDRNVFNI